MALNDDIEDPGFNCYVSAQEASDYFTDRGHGETWEDIVDSDPFLISATNQLDWYMNWKGEKVVVSQPKEWPRNYVYDSSGITYLPNGEVPVQVKQAVYELAIASVEIDRVADSDMAGLQEVKVGSLKIVSNSVGPWQEKKRAIPNVIYRILEDLIYNSSSMFKMVTR